MHPVSEIAFRSSFGVILSTLRAACMTCVHIAIVMHVLIKRGYFIHEIRIFIVYLVLCSVLVNHIITALRDYLNVLNIWVFFSDLIYQLHEIIIFHFCIYSNNILHFITLIISMY